VEFFGRLRKLGIGFHYSNIPALSGQQYYIESPVFQEFHTKRKTEFLTGRYCAKNALEEIGYNDEWIGISENRCPAWPKGTVGSITHDGHYCAGVAAREEMILSIGIDYTVHRTAPEEFVGSIVEPQELAVLSEKCSQKDAFFSLFSIKEAAYKCLYPILEVPIYFKDLKIDSVDWRRGTFSLILNRNLSPEFMTGKRLSGIFYQESGAAAAAVICTGDYRLEVPRV